MKALQFSFTIPQFVALKSLGAISKQAFYKGRLATVKLSNVPEPKLPNENWVKIKTLYCGFCGSDLNLIFLRESPSASPFSSFPCILGHEFCGEIIEIGQNVTNVNIGDIVIVAPHLGCEAREISPMCPVCSAGRPANCENFTNGSLAPGMFIGLCKDVGGGFAPYVVAHQSQLFMLPEGLDPKIGALTEPLAVALQAILDNRPNDSDKVLVIGGGVIGQLLVWCIRALGIKCMVTVSEPMPHAGEMAKKAGADHLIKDGDLLSGTARITGAMRYTPILGKDVCMGGFTKIFDCVGHADTLNLAMRCMATLGTMSIVGIGDNVKLDLTPLWLKLQALKGVFAYGYNQINGQREHTFETAMNLAQKNPDFLLSIITHIFELSDFDKMIKTNMAKGKTKAVKTMVKFF